MVAGDHVSKLAATLTSAVEGFTPDGPFLIRVAVLVGDFTHNFFTSRLTRSQRTVCARNSSDTYWPLVAKELEEIRNGDNPNQSVSI